MWTNTGAARRLGIRIPIIQGPFGGSFSTVRLAASVSNAGGLGSFGAQALPGTEIRRVIRELRAATDQPFAVNLWVSDHDVPDGQAESGLAERFADQVSRLKPFHDELGIEPPDPPAFTGERFEEQIGAILDERPPVFSFVFGIPPQDVLGECRRRGIVTIGAATNVEEAMANEAAGVDVVLATGCEAGGHRPTFLRRAEDSLIGTLALLPQVVDVVKTPVIAAGGIADARGVAAVFKLGAGAAQIGTAFLACEESGASGLHRQRLLGGHAGETSLSRAYTGRLARFIRNRFIDSAALNRLLPLPFPYQSHATARLKEAAIDQQRADLAALYAGQGAPLIRHRRARDLFDALVSGTSEILGGEPGSP